MLEKSYLRSSGQLWKLWLGLTHAVLGWIRIPLELAGYMGPGDAGSLLIVAGVSVAVCGSSLSTYEQSQQRAEASGRKPVVARFLPTVLVQRELEAGAIGYSVIKQHGV